jgi:hypothetical protein
LPRNPSPGSTLSSIAPSLDKRRSWVRVLKTLILVAALIWVVVKTVASVRAIQRGELSLHVDARWLALSAVVYLSTNALLIWSWLYLVRGLAGRSIRFLHGARIWFVSNLGTLIPGKVWSIVQMGAMSVDEGINPVAAAAASVINTAINISTGMAIGIITGASIVASYLGPQAWLGWALAAVAMVGVLALPVLVPWGLNLLRRFGMAVPSATAPPRTIAVAALANVASWFMYGAAFLCLNRGLVDSAAHSVMQHTAAYTTSYVIGYLFLIAPGGFGPREVSLNKILVSAGMSTPAQATALTLVSRLWTLTLMIVPALIFLAYRRPRHEKDPAR